MLLGDHMQRTGQSLFRWRSYVLLAFVPFIALTLFNGEAIELRFGEGFGDLYESFCIALVVLGEAIRILTVGFVPAGTSGRNTKAQIAEALNTTGAYSLVRNPLYLGNCMMYVGVVAYTQNVTLTLVFALVLMLYYERIIAAEEGFLAQKYGAAYRDWAAEVPAFIPRVTGWQRPALPFCLRTVIKREHASIFGGFLALWLVDAGLNALSPEPEGMGMAEFYILGLAMVAELTVLMIKKRTPILRVAGR
ncbi:isoprenylcysteine carboxylmethyltransferase family protein [Defluviimonas aestuarii]|uniref:methyltransferase family protein n=1 Tax=Albidovulum aestuarii TaxID=1130726 RepID=UPI00249C6726|nr:isoprenylcysteine carboxylmethyltransferase family protein [Defluviimonas aestuarii]MDI3335361.1 isoprenylcysteine carboxylmethyltransferase family protein [Defluviimonas aestuarii]